MDIVENIGNFTVFVKTDIKYDKFDVTRTNTYDINGDGSPIYGLNLFTVDEMLSYSTNGKIKNYKDIASDGAIIMVSSIWNCDFDEDVNECNPEFNFERIDNINNTISHGFNFRTVTYDVTKKYRLLEKLHGIRVLFVVDGTGRKFNFAALTVTLGAGLAYLSVAKVITDLILDKFMKKSDIYNEFRYKEIDDDELDTMNTAVNDMTYQAFSD